MGIIGNNQIVRSDNEQLLNAPFGQQGATIITDTTVYTGDWYCVVALTDNTELDATGTIVNWGLNGVLGMPLANDIPLIAGVPMYGDFTRIQLVAVECTVIAYNK